MKEAEAVSSVSHTLAETLVQPKLIQCHLQQRLELGKAIRQSVMDLKLLGSERDQHLHKIKGLPWLSPKPKGPHLKTLVPELMKPAVALQLTQKAIHGVSLAWRRKSLIIGTTAMILLNSTNRYGTGLQLLSSARQVLRMIALLNTVQLTLSVQALTKQNKNLARKPRALLGLCQKKRR